MAVVANLLCGDGKVCCWKFANPVLPSHASYSWSLPDVFDGFKMWNSSNVASPIVHLMLPTCMSLRMHQIIWWFCAIADEVHSNPLVPLSFSVTTFATVLSGRCIHEMVDRMVGVKGWGPTTSAWLWPISSWYIYCISCDFGHHSKALCTFMSVIICGLAI